MKNRENEHETRNSLNILSRCAVQGVKCGMEDIWKRTGRLSEAQGVDFAEGARAWPQLMCCACLMPCSDFGLRSEEGWKAGRHMRNKEEGN